LLKIVLFIIIQEFIIIYIAMLFTIFTININIDFHLYEKLQKIYLKLTDFYLFYKNYKRFFKKYIIIVDFI
jgi:hypothetical protein